MLIGLPSIVAQTAYVLVLSMLLPAALSRARWVLRSPRLAITVWQALSAAWLLSLVLLGLTLAQRVIEHLAWPAGEPPVTGGEWSIAATGLAIAAAIVTRAGFVVVRELAWARRQRSSHALALSLAGTPADLLGATIVEHDTPAVYSLPTAGRRNTVVISRGALRVLTDRQLAAVVAHEHGHLRLHHHRVIAIAGALELAFPRVPLLRIGREQIELLAEMAADYHARRDHTSDTLAGALLALATAPTPRHALGASGHTVTSRLRRMFSSTRPLPAPARAATLTTAAGAVGLPAALSCTTVFAAVGVVAGRVLS
ncbi:MAG: M48 family metalloprotease [Solirubrobacteraceae bacterium]